MSKIMRTNRYNENNINYLIGCFIRKARRARGMSGKEFSQKLNISHQQLSRYERGLTSFTLCKLILFLRALEKILMIYSPKFIGMKIKTYYLM
ncbi:helix-turn-helix domain-containing protein [Providencia manganoxydans]|uniref:helix-turn-helix domain-containing protein n=1 Tax=Providencia manganoxydans TaxID=2923283 RepID=UPI0034E46532